ncbi:acetyltransferase [Ustulina deusta]|nr:acetyltransferase [Ustulina deusta]KAI3341742.1 acetyltransferase [Ustulina deusta]
MATQTNNKPTALTVTDGEQPVGGVASEHTIPPTAILVTEKCYLRPYEVSDAEPMAEAANDPEITKYLRSRFPSPYTLADAHEFIALCRSLPAPALSFGIFTLEGEIAGSMALEPPKGDPVYAGTRELGYYLVPKFWGRGIMSTLVREFTRWAFATVPDLLRIEAAVFEPNKGSQRVLQKAGFVKEGTRRLAVVKDGKQMSEDMFGLIRTDIEA